LIRVLHYMSWVRQTLAGSKDVRGMILTESANAALSDIVKEVPNVQLRFYRIGIELLDNEHRALAETTTGNDIHLLEPQRAIICIIYFQHSTLSTVASR